MLRRVSAYLALVVGLCLGVALSYMPMAGAARNSSGTYSLPSGTTVSSGQTITSSWANTLTADIATELTNSLDRTGRGAMSQPLQLSNGTVSAPSLTFSSDTDTGVYRIGANDVGVAAGGTKVQEWTATGSPFALPALASDGTVSAPGFSFTNDTNTGLYRIGADNPAMAANGAKRQEWTTTGSAITGTFSVSGASTLTGAVTASSTVGVTGLVSAAGNVQFTGADPASTTGFSDTSTSMNVIKGWALVDASTFTVTAGFSVTSAADATNCVDVNWATSFGSANYGCVVTANTSQHDKIYCLRTSASKATVCALDTAGAQVDLSSGTFTIMAVGAN